MQAYNSKPHYALLDGLRTHRCRVFSTYWHGALGRHTRHSRAHTSCLRLWLFDAAGAARYATRGAWQWRDVSAQRTVLVTFLRVYRQHRVCAHHTPPLHTLALPADGRFVLHLDVVRRHRSVGLRVYRCGLDCRQYEYARRIAANALPVHRRRAAFAHLQAFQQRAWCILDKHRCVARTLPRTLYR